MTAAVFRKGTDEAGSPEHVGGSPHMSSRMASNTDPPEAESPGALAGATGALRNSVFQSTAYARRLANTTRLTEALADCHKDEALPIAAAYIETKWGGPPAADPLGDAKADAALWAAGASEAELVEVSLAAHTELHHRPLHINAVKRLLVSAWRLATARLSASAMQKFLGRVDAQGRFWSRGGK